MRMELLFEVSSSVGEFVRIRGEGTPSFREDSLTTSRDRCLLSWLGEGEDEAGNDRGVAAGGREGKSRWIGASRLQPSVVASRKGTKTTRQNDKGAYLIASKKRNSEPGPLIFWSSGNSRTVHHPTGFLLPRLPGPIPAR